MAPNVSLLAESSVIEGPLYVRICTPYTVTETYKTDTVDQRFFEVMSRSKLLEAVVSAMKETLRWGKTIHVVFKYRSRSLLVESGGGRRSNESLQH